MVKHAAVLFLLALTLLASACGETETIDFDDIRGSETKAYLASKDAKTELKVLTVDHDGTYPADDVVQDTLREALGKVDVELVKVGALARPDQRAQVSVRPMGQERFSVCAKAKRGEVLCTIAGESEQWTRGDSEADTRAVAEQPFR